MSKKNTEMVKENWLNFLNSRSYPLTNFVDKKTGENFDWDNQQIKNKESYKVFINDKHKNGKFLAKKFTSLCFTLHNPWKYFASPKDMEDVFEKLKKYVESLIVSYEVGDNGVTHHLQGFMKFKNEMRLNNKDILSKFKTKDLNIENAKGNESENYAYITKTENSNIQKYIYEFGDFTKLNCLRKKFDCSDFVDFALKNNLLITEDLMDLYCEDYRKNPNRAKSVIIALYNARKKMPFGELQHLTFCGASGSGKSLISRYLILKTGITFPRDIVKQEASADNKRMWFNNDSSLKRICWITEMNYTFPRKTHLLSLLDKETPLQVKGKDAVPNFFDVLLLNSTNMTPFTIYNITQLVETSYLEIARRLREYGNMYFVFENKEWSALPYAKRRQLLMTNYFETVEKYAPLIFKNINTNFPSYNIKLHFNNASNNEDRKARFTSHFVLEDDQKTVAEYVEKYEWDKQIYNTCILYKVEQVTLQDVEKDFKNVLISVNSLLLNNYGKPKRLLQRANDELEAF